MIESKVASPVDGPHAAAPGHALDPVPSELEPSARSAIRAEI